MSDLNFNHARDSEQKRIMSEAQQNGLCPFCWKDLENHHPKPILKKGIWWWLSENAWPYKGTERHFILFYKEHVKNISDISPAAFADLNNLIRWVEKNYPMEGYSLFIRSGEMERTGSSVQHIHVQLLSGNSKRGQGSEDLKVKLGYKKVL